MIQEQELIGISCVSAVSTQSGSCILPQLPCDIEVSTALYRYKNAPQLAKVLEPEWKSRFFLKFDH